MNGELQAIFRRHDAIVWLASAADMRPLFANARASELLGLPADSWESDPDFWARWVHPDDLSDFLASLSGSVASGEPSHCVHRARTADGRELQLATEVLFLPANEDRTASLCGIARETQAPSECMSGGVAAPRRTGESELSILLRAGQLLARGGGLPAMVSIAELVVPAHADRCTIDVLEAEGVLTRVAAWPPGAAGEPYQVAPDARQGAGKVVRTGETELVHEPAAGVEAFGADARSRISAPLQFEGRNLGVISFIATSDRRYTPLEVPFVQELGRRLGLFAEYRRLRAASAPVEPPDSGIKLTDRQLEILRLVAQGLTSRAIAATLSIGHRTVESHRLVLFKKLGVKNQVELVRRAVSIGMVRLDE